MKKQRKSTFPATDIPIYFHDVQWRNQDLFKVGGDTNKFI